MNNRVKHYRFLLTAVTVVIILTLVFIFTRSAKSIPDSAEESNSVSTLIKPIVDPEDKIPDKEFISALRKAAHLIEFFVLGIEVSVLTLLLFLKKAISRLNAVVYSMFFCFIIAVLDETVQIFSMRGSGVADIWIDTAGAALATATVFCISSLIRETIKRKQL